MKNETKSLSEVRDLARGLNHDGIQWMHADRRFIRAHTSEQWTDERKSKWKATARAVYPWARISLFGPSTWVSSIMHQHAGLNLIEEATLREEPEEAQS